MSVEGVAHQPREHLALESQVLSHVRRLLQDQRLRLDTRQGQRPVTQYRLHVVEGDGVGRLRELLAGHGITDRTVEASFPREAKLDVALLRRRWFVLAETVARLHVRVLAPVEALASGEPPRPATLAEVQRAVADALDPRVPTTVVLASTAGFAVEARELADRKPDRTVILLEPNGAGGWRVFGPTEIRSVVDLFDPEGDDEKRKRVRDYVLAREIDLGGSGLSADKVASVTMLPVQLVEAELKRLSQEAPGWVARRLDGRLVLYRQGAALQPPAAHEPAMLDRVRDLFSRKGETEKKIAYLSERRAALGQQRDRIYEELSKLEAHETSLKNEYRHTAGPLGKRRITSHLLQLRKDVQRRQQLLSSLNQHIQVLGVHLHNLELARTGTAHGLPAPEHIAEDAAKAEEVLAELQAGSESAGAMGAGPVAGGLTDEETRLMQELDAELAGTPARFVADAAPAVAPARPLSAMRETATSPSAPPSAQARPAAPPTLRLVRPESEPPNASPEGPETG
ncbi:MAG: hypothetical protein ACK4PI_01340 [Tepidisphaerales bacterium]